MLTMNASYIYKKTSNFSNWYFQWKKNKYYYIKMQRKKTNKKHISTISTIEIVNIVLSNESVRCWFQLVYKSTSIYTWQIHRSDKRNDMIFGTFEIRMIGNKTGVKDQARWCYLKVGRGVGSYKFKRMSPTMVGQRRKFFRLEALKQLFERIKIL